MGGLPAPLETMIEALQRLPGIGRRTAERLALHLLRAPAEEAEVLVGAITEARERVRLCARCRDFSLEEVCAVCADPARDSRRLLVVEEARDVRRFEESGRYEGRYHVLMGRVSPLEGAGVREAGADELVRRVREDAVEEVILGMNADVEGDATALAILEVLRDLPVEVTRLARGLPSGYRIEFAGNEVLADALEARRPLRGGPERA